MASDEVAPRRKHYSPSDEPEESSKRRKRHHHRRHHRSHRHRSKDDREKREKRDVATPPVSSNLNMDEDKEEGEILEEEDQLGICEEPKKIMDSDVESGEIKADGGGQGLSDRKDDQKVICIEEHFVPRGSLEVLNLDMSKSGDKVGVCLMQPPKNALAVEKFDEYCSDCKVSGHREKKYEEDVSSSEKISNQSKVDVKLRESESTAGIRRGETCFEGDSRDLRRLARSKSPISKEILDPLKHSKTGESKSVFYDSKKHRERSVSPIKSKDKHVSVRRSPSINDRYHEDLRGRNRSRSLDHTRSDRSSLYSHDCNVGSREYSRIDYDHKRAGQHGVDDYHDSRDRWRDMESDRIKRLERERSSSYSRYSAKDEKYGSRNMDFVAENDKYRDKTGRASSHIQNDRERERGREKHRDLEREERKVEKRRDRFENRDIDRESWRDRSKDRRNGTDIDRERRRDRDQTRRSHTYGDLEDGHISHDNRNRRIAKDSEKEHNGHGEGKNKFGEEDEADDYEERIALKLAEQEEEDIEKIKEESRKRRQAILEKYKQQEEKQQEEEEEEEEEEDEMADSLPDVVSKGYMPTSNKLREQLSPSEANRNVGNEIISQGLENERDSPDIYMADSLFSVGKSPVQNGNIASEKFSFAGELDGTPKSEWLSDMFCDDIFGESPAVRKPGKGDGLHVEKSGLHDNWDDAEGYYSYRFGEILDGRYEVTAAHGKGVFSTVVRAKDLKAGKDDPPEVAIKIIRSNDTMRKAGFEELRILRMLADADLEDRRHCVRFITNFNYRNHLCLVFESLHMNLREVLKKFGRNIGLKLTAVRAYAKQLFIALKHLRNCGVLHSDIKPDNMLVNEAKNVLKLCDFGSAMSAGKNEITPYLVSRFYRAPEIILGLPYDHPMDMWSVGCCLYELYTGKVLFPGPSNNDMLRLHMELKGPFPKKMLRKGAFADQHFDQDLNFYATEEDPVTKKTLKKLLVNMKPKDVGLLIASSPGEDLKMVSNFKDLLDKIFILDPDKRLTVSQALSHPFITGK